MVLICQNNVVYIKRFWVQKQILVWKTSLGPKKILGQKNVGSKKISNKKMLVTKNCMSRIILDPKKWVKKNFNQRKL